MYIVQFILVFVLACDTPILQLSSHANNTSRIVISILSLAYPLTSSDVPLPKGKCQAKGEAMNSHHCMLLARLTCMTTIFDLQNVDPFIVCY